MKLGLEHRSKVGQKMKYTENKNWHHSTDEKFLNNDLTTCIKN